MSETAFHPTVKGFLEPAGFEVKGEVCGCDIAVRNEEPSRLAIVEMKARLQPRADTDGTTVR